jgi:hypothetical protein
LVIPKLSLIKREFGFHTCNKTLYIGTSNNSVAEIGDAGAFVPFSRGRCILCMSNLYVGIDNVAKKVNNIYIGVDGIARKILKGYVGIDGIAQQFYSGAIEINYTGTYTTSDVTVDGVSYTLWTLTGSGTLTASDSVRYWMCGGGANSRPAVDTAAGGAGGAYTANGTLDAGTHVITVAAAAGKSTIGSVTAASGGGPGVPSGGSGGSGGGSASPNNPGASGDGESKYPFGLTSLKAHCPGGGAGAVFNFLTKYNGGNGGTNGGSGSAATSANISTNTVIGGAGGTNGGGKGGNASEGSAGNGASGSFYGAGGGGGAYYNVGSATKVGSGGTGYQGVVYILVPKAA